MLARLFVFFGGLLVVALCAILLAPFFVNWAGYRSAFEREASRIIGQPVRVEGTAKARILPFPSVTFSNVVIDGADGIPAARIAAFSMDAELAPFLSGEILIFDMRIERPDVRLKLAENGALLWALPQSEALDGRTIALENVNVSEGRLTVERERGEPLLFDGVNGKVSAQTLTGPWVADGRFIHGTTAYSARLSTGAKIAGETLRARVSLVPQGGFYEVAFDGQIGSDNGAPNYKGKLDAAILGTLVDTKGIRQKIADLKGDFVASAAGLNVSQAVLVAGPQDKAYRTDGSASIIFGENARFDVSLKGQQISFDDADNGGKTGRVKPSVPLIDRVAAIQSAIAQIPVPDMPGSVDLTLPALVIGDTIIRNAVVKASPAGTGWTIDRYSAEMPGRTLVEGKGDLALGEEFGFIGQITLASKQPTGLASWLGLNTSDALRSLQGAGFSSRVDLSTMRQTFRDLEFRAGNTVLRGLIGRQVLNGAKPRISMQLTGDNADLDAAAGLVNMAGGLPGRISEQDFDVWFSSTNVSGYGFLAEKLITKIKLVDGVLNIEDLDVSNLAGADVRASGTVAYGNNPGAEMNVTVAAIDPMPLIDALSARFTDHTWLKELANRAGYAGTALADATFKGILSGSGVDGFGVDYNFDAAGLRFDGNATVSGEVLALSAKGDVDAGDTLLAGMGLPVGDTVTALQLLEPVSFETSVEAKAGDIQTGSLKAASVQDILETSFGPGVQPFKLTLTDAAPYAMAGGYGLPGGAAFGLPLKLEGLWEKTGTTLNLQKLEGTLVDVPISGDVALSQGERLKLTGNIRAQTLDRSLVDDVVFGPLSAVGDDQVEFSGGMSLPIDADMTLAAGKATGFLPLVLEQASARIVAHKDGLRFVDASANIAGGKLTGAGEVRKNGPEAQVRLNGSVMGIDISKVYPVGVNGQSDLQIELGATGSTRAGLAASMIGSGVLSTKKIAIVGINTKGFKALVEEADALNIAPDPIATLEMATRSIMSGQIALSPLQTAFTVTSGVLRAPRSQLKIEGGTLSFEPKLDLNSGATDIAATLQFDTGEDQLSGAEPSVNLRLIGQWNDLRLDIDPSLLQGFLGQRALEREEIRVEAIQSQLLEKQRLRRENRYYAGLIEARAKAEADRLAEVKRAADAAAKAEQERLENEKLEQERIKIEKATAVGQAPLPQEAPGDAPLKPPLNLDGLIKELEAKPTLQP